MDKLVSSVPATFCVLFVAILSVDICLFSIVGVQFVTTEQICVGQFHACQKDPHTLHTGTSEGAEMIGTLDTEKTVAGFLAHNYKPIFYDLR